MNGVSYTMSLLSWGETLEHCKQMLAAQKAMMPVPTACPNCSSKMPIYTPLPMKICRQKHSETGWACKSGHVTRPFQERATGMVGNDSPSLISQLQWWWELNRLSLSLLRSPSSRKWLFLISQLQWWRELNRDSLLRAQLAEFDSFSLANCNDGKDGKSRIDSRLSICTFHLFTFMGGDGGETKQCTPDMLK